MAGGFVFDGKRCGVGRWRDSSWAEGWEVRSPRSRIFYEDERGRTTAVVTGAAVYRDGYCAAQPGDSNRGFVGFTEQPFDAWVAAVRGGRPAMSTGTTRERVRLAD